MQNRIYNQEQAGTCNSTMLQGPGKDQRAERTKTKNQTNLRQKAPRNKNDMDRNQKAKSR